ncbi:MAG: hypothetical protein JSU72_02600 [Deltaproteobacteria bacterium]|nr:MAG: hypothetical protein JSU72_02600 [Deltaproteobacteria bacterium]
MRRQRGQFNLTRTSMVNRRPLGRQVTGTRQELQRSFRNPPIYTGRGRILRVKQGYNPNSSSMGSIVFALPVVLLGVSVAFGVFAGIISSAFLRTRHNASPGEVKQDATFPPTREDKPAAVNRETEL